MNQIEDMQTFVRIVEAGSITKAAEQMNTVKSAVSRRLSELEKRLGVALLTRTTRSQSLTDSGKSYYLQSVRIIDDVAEVESSILNEHCALVGRIKVAVPLSFGLAHLAPALRKFNEIQPGIHFDIDFNDRKVDLIEEGFDLAIRITQLEDSSLIARKITSTQMILAASPAYLKTHGHPKSIKDLLNVQNKHVKLNYKNSPENWSFFDGNKKLVTLNLPSVLDANNGEYLCQAAVDGMGLIYIPDFICYKYIKLKQLIPILTNHIKLEELGTYAIYPQTRHLSRRVRNLIDFLSEYFGDVPYWSTV
ncbi:MAG: LysR family transcriptional regulator [Alcanivoracaceae bacterium]|nr:LysR family transcriptional regulator [Alcanivoracaceae bacterium]